MSQSYEPQNLKPFAQACFWLLDSFSIPEGLFTPEGLFIATFPIAQAKKQDLKS